MKITTNRFLLPFLAILGFLLCVDPAWGQYLGSVSPQTVQTTLAPLGTACTGADQIFPVQNLGQGNHYAAAQPLGVTSFQMEIDGVDAAGYVYRISDQQFSTPGYSGSAITGSGYYPKIRVKVNCLPATTATFTLTYSGGSSISPINSGTYSLSQLDKAVFTGVDATSNQTAVFQSPLGNSGGILALQFSASPPTGAILGVSCKGSIATGSYTTQTYFPAASSSFQLFQVPSMPCPFVTVTYTKGTGGIAFSLEYIFDNPGRLPFQATAAALSSSINFPAILAEKGGRWAIVHTPSVSTQASASKTAGASDIQHVADCISYSAGATTAPAATQLTLNLRDGATGAGTVLWSKTVVIPATAANHLDGNVCGLNLMGSLATAMTLEFSAGLTNEFESVTLTGYDVQ